MIVDSETVTWYRYEKSGQDALGNSGSVLASGFPQTVRGVIRFSDGDSPLAGQGFVTRRDAVFYSRSFFTGRVGDIAVARGVTMVVRKVVDKSTAASVLSHFKYVMERTELAAGSTYIPAGPEAS